MTRCVPLFFIVSLWGVTLFAGPGAGATQRLFEAVGDMKLTDVASAIEDGADVNAVDDDGWPLFITAVNSGQMGIIRLFLTKKELDLGIAGPDGKTAFMHAIVMKNRTLAEILLQKGSSIHTPDGRGKTPLMYAAEIGDEKLVQLLLDKGADRNAKDEEGKTALEYAFESRRKGAIDLLSKTDRLPVELVAAAQRGDGAAVRSLLAKGAPIDAKAADGKPLLVMAVEKGFLDVLKALIDGKADVNGKYFKGSTLLMFAFHKGQLGAAELILRSGGEGDLNLKYKEGKTALMLAIEEDRPSLVNLLMGKPFKVNQTDSYGKTALFYAVEKNNGDLVDRLLGLGADPTARQFEGKTAAQVAKEKGLTTIEKLLKQAEAASNR
ncbi:MAG TPA: ankyrin repeat domain-containing protein [bacterium]|nr:ankyrin repeat domain-containing protein [bacterium]